MFHVTIRSERVKATGSGLLLDFSLPIAIVVLLLLLSLIPASTLAAQLATLAEEQRVKSGTTVEISFDLTEIPKEQQARLSLDARIDWPDLAGFNPWMIVRVNGKSLVGTDLVNKPLEFATRNGVEFAWQKGLNWTILYSPDFSDTIRTRLMPWGFADVAPYYFAWDITPYVHTGRNTVSFNHLPLLAQGTTLVLRGVKVEIGDPIKPVRSEEVKPAPQAPLPTYIARGPQRVPMDVRVSPGGTMRLRVGTESFDIASRTSEPEGKWSSTTEGKWAAVPRGKSARAQWTGTGYRVNRTVTVNNDHVHVADTIANTSDRVVGVIYEHRLDLGNREKPRILLGGRPVCASEGADEPAHPSAIAEWNDLTIGMFAEDDLFRIHVRSFSDAKAMGLADPRLGIPPGKSHTLEWSLYPVPKGDYWDLINAVRRNWGSNITIPGPGLFDGATDGSKDLDYYKDMVNSRKVKLVFSGQTDFKGAEIQKGIDLAEGTAIPMAKQWCASAAEWVKKLHAAAPNVKALVYLHPSNCTEPNADKLYADSKLLDVTGAQVTSPYRYPVYEYLSSLDNTYGRALLRTVDTIFKEINPDGIFMDEISGGSVPQYAYQTQWDGCTLDIDQQTHAIARQYSSVVLLEQSWKTAMIKYLREHGKLIVGNGPARTRTMVDWKMPYFTELGSYSFVTDVHLCAPWALGNHDNDNDDRVRARMVRRALDYGGVICVYSWGDTPQGFHYMHVMYPITPVELHAGMVLGEERIITNRSGRYGWPEGSPAQGYVFDGEGKLVPKPMVKEVREQGRRLLEVRMPSDHFAVLVKSTSQ